MGIVMGIVMLFLNKQVISARNSHGGWMIYMFLQVSNTYIHPFSPTTIHPPSRTFNCRITDLLLLSNMCFTMLCV